MPIRVGLALVDDLLYRSGHFGYRLSIGDELETALSFLFDGDYEPMKRLCASEKEIWTIFSQGDGLRPPTPRGVTLEAAGLGFRWYPCG